MATLDDLRTELLADGGLLAEAVREAPAGPALPDGPRAEIRLLAEAIREGYELHYGTARVVATADADLALLAGDRLYALGLERLAQLGDLDAVRVLADLISDSARLHAEGRGDEADAVWRTALAELHRAGSPEPGATAC